MEKSPRISNAHSCVYIVASSENRINGAIQKCLNESANFQLEIAKQGTYKSDYQCHSVQTLYPIGKTTMVSLFTTCEGNLSDEQLKAQLPEVYSAVIAERKQELDEKVAITKLLDGANNIFGTLTDRLISPLDSISAALKNILEIYREKTYGPRVYNSAPDLTR